MTLHDHAVLLLQIAAELDHEQYGALPVPASSSVLTTESRLGRIVQVTLRVETEAQVNAWAAAFGVEPQRLDPTEEDREPTVSASVSRSTFVLQVFTSLPALAVLEPSQ